MKLDHDVVRNLLLKIESEADETGLSTNAQKQIAIDLEISESLLGYTINRVNEANLITGKALFSSNSFYSFSPIQLTFKGHEYLDNIRAPKVWKQSKSVAEKIGSVSLNVMSNIASDIILKTLNLK